MTMPTPDDRVELHPGMEVVSSDDEKLVKAVALDQSQLTVDKGFFFATDDYVPLYEEELTATTRPVEAGAVQINKDVVTEERSLDVPITEERVRVTRRAVDRDATGTLGADAFTEGTLDVPVRREAVDVQKRVRADEEDDITREPVQTTQTVTGAVRREVVNVEDHTDVDATDGTTGTTAAGSSS